MWIDTNAYVGHWPFRQMQYGTCELLLKHMNKFGVNQSVVSNLNGVFYQNTQVANRELYDEIRSLGKQSGRFIPFGVINPIYAGWEYDMDECINVFGMKGIRLYPKYHDYKIDDPRLVQLVLKAKNFGIPVCFNHWMIDPRSRSWMDIDYLWLTDKPEWDLNSIMPIIKLVPEAKYMILHATNSMALSKDDEKIFKKADVLIDTSGRSVNNLLSLAQTYGIERFAFGTHSPLHDYLTGMLRIESLRPAEADEATKEMLRSGNAKRFLGI